MLLVRLLWISPLVPLLRSGVTVDPCPSLKPQEDPG